MEKAGRVYHPLMLPPAEAWSRIAARLSALPEEKIARRSARGRRLARPLAATVDVPAADVSAMDGYAAGGPVEPGARRDVTGIIAAGDLPGAVLAPPAVVRIMTGAPVPLGADRVIPVEATDGGRETVLFRAAAAPGDHIRRRGEILRAGEPLLPAGTLLTPGALSLLATHGHVEVPVHRAPSVAILVTGDEVVRPESLPAPGQLRDSHTDFLLAAGETLGLRFESLGIAPDRVETLREMVRHGLRSDVLLLSGGVSMGEFDLVEGVLAELGCTIHLDAVAIQPGKPFVFATHPQGLVFGLPGNPASVMVAFWLFVRPALRRLLGFADTWWSGAVTGVLAAPLPGAGPRDRFTAAEVEARDGVLYATPFPPLGSHDQAAYAHGTALVRSPAGSPRAEAGAACEVLLLD
jgi:molybdopterin molybdotransferase